MTHVPPKIAELLLTNIAPPDDREYLVDDLAEEFAVRAQRDGSASARRWYWSETVRSIVPLTWRRLSRSSRSSRSLQAVAPGSPDELSRSSILDDLRYARRMAVRSPISTTAVVLTMVIAIGATTAVFNVVNAVLLRPLPFAGSERVVRIGATLRDGRNAGAVAKPDFEAFLSEVGAFESATGFSTLRMTLRNDSYPVPVDVIQVDSGYAETFALPLAMGRPFALDEFTYGGPATVIVTHAFWQSRLGGDPEVLGKAVMLNDVPRTIIGVLAADAFTYPLQDAQLLLPLAISPTSFMNNRGAVWMGATARIRDGVSFEQAQEQLSLVAQRLALEYPDANSGIGAVIEPLRETLVGDVRKMLLLLAASVGAVLLIACSNVANLLLGQLEARTREFAVRAAIGASGSRLRQQVFTESVAIAFVGGVLGVLLASNLTRVIIAVYPGELPRASEISMDVRVVLVALLAIAIGGVLAGLPTAVRISGRSLSHQLRAGERHGMSQAARRVSSGLVVIQIAVSMVLVVAAGLLGQTFLGLARVDPGFDPNGVSVFRVSAGPPKYENRQQVTAMQLSLLDSLRAIPGVTEAGITTDLPLSQGQFRGVYQRVGYDDMSPNLPIAATAFVSEDYTSVMKIPIVSGRSLRSTDDLRSPRAILVNEALARRDFPGEDAVGKRLELVGMVEGDPWEIVGVVRSFASQNLWEESTPEVFVPIRHLGSYDVNVVVRSALSLGALLPSIRQAVRRIDESLAVMNPAEMPDRLHQSLAPQRFRALLVGSFGVLALMLAIVGMYGTVAHAVSRRTREIGIRMALGAGAGQIRRSVVMDAMQLVLVGGVAGGIVALASARLIESFLVDIDARQPLLVAAVGFLLVMVAFLAAYAPARRASRVKPTTALRSE